MSDWRRYVEQFAAVTLVNVEEYAAEFDAIDAAVAHAPKWIPNAVDVKHVWNIPAPDVEEGVDLVIYKMPTLAVPTSRPDHLCVALLQHMHWARAAPFASEKIYAATYAGRGCLPDPIVLLRRRREPSIEVKRDCLRLAVGYQHLPEFRRRVSDIIYPVLKLVERHHLPPVPDELVQPLEDLLLVAEEQRLRERERRPWERRRTPKPTKRLDALIDRMRLLLGRTD